MNGDVERLAAVLQGHAENPLGGIRPGKIIDAPKMDEHLRYGSGYRAWVWNSPLSFAEKGGMEVAIEQCNGQGVCRSTLFAGSSKACDAI